MSTIRVLIADDQPLARAGFKAVLHATGTIEVVAEAENGEHAVELARRHSPDVVLMDIRMPGMDGIEATRRMPRQKVLILTTFGLDEYIIEALRAGASGFLLKDAPVEDLIRAVRTVAAGDAQLSPAVTKRLLEQVAREAEELESDARYGRRERRFVLATWSTRPASATAAELGLIGDRPAGVVPVTVAKHLLEADPSLWRLALQGFIAATFAETVALAAAAARRSHPAPTRVAA